MINIYIIRKLNGSVMADGDMPKEVFQEGKNKTIPLLYITCTVSGKC